jgi:hypothetical protein
MTEYLHHAVFAVEFEFETIGSVLQGKGLRKLCWESATETRTIPKFILEAMFRDHHLYSSGYLPGFDCWFRISQSMAPVKSHGQVIANVIFEMPRVIGERKFRGVRKKIFNLV